MTDIDGASLNSEERKVRDLLQAKLGNRATITKLKQEGGRIDIEVVSHNFFNWAASALEEAAGPAAEASNCRLDVKLMTSWSRK